MSWGSWAGIDSRGVVSDIGAEGVGAVDATDAVFIEDVDAVAVNEDKDGASNVFDDNAGVAAPC